MLWRKKHEQDHRVEERRDDREKAELARRIRRIELTVRAMRLDDPDEEPSEVRPA